MLSLKEKVIKENLDKQFGDRESAREIKNAIFLANTGKLTDEMIEEYRRQKEEEQELIRQQFSELNPSYAFDYPILEPNQGAPAPLRTPDLQRNVVPVKPPLPEVTAFVKVDDSINVEKNHNISPVNSIDNITVNAIVSESGFSGDSN